MTFLIFACFITGFICGCLCHKNKLSFKIFWMTGDTNDGQQFPNKVSVSQDLEMTENVAYGQVRSQWLLFFSELFTNCPKKPLIMYCMTNWCEKFTFTYSYLHTRTCWYLLLLCSIWVNEFLLVNMFPNSRQHYSCLEFAKTKHSFLFKSLHCWSWQLRAQLCL